MTIDSTAERDQLTVERNGQLLPLSSYGTGIHELIILAIAVLQHDKAIVCIEEPEIHLHPLLQRRFIEFLRNETTNRYVITTHSPALITPHKETAITHLWLDEKGVTRSRPVETTNDGLSALHDLGAQASDLLQANSVIWVEGPSDRIYLRRWLELLHPGEFTEGIDYTIMFYGGRLLSHLSLERDVASPESEEQEADELIQLLRINQHAAILIDSDRRKASDELNPTKRRVIDEATQSKVFCWVTEGREIENYLPVAAISAAYSAESGQSVELSLDQFETLEDALKRAFTTVWPRKHYYEHAKAQWARAIAEHMTADHLTPHLRTQLAALVAVIQHPSPSLSPVHPA